MGSISFQVVGDASVGTKSKTFTVSDANINRLVEWGRRDNPELTVAQALGVWVGMMMDLTKASVIAHERQTASVSPFEAT